MRHAAIAAAHPNDDPAAEARGRLERSACSAPIECEVTLVDFIVANADDVIQLLADLGKLEQA